MDLNSRIGSFFWFELLRQTTVVGVLQRPGIQIARAPAKEIAGSHASGRGAGNPRSKPAHEKAVSLPTRTADC